MKKGQYQKRKTNIPERQLNLFYCTPTKPARRFKSHGTRVVLKALINDYLLILISRLHRRVRSTENVWWFNRWKIYLKKKTIFYRSRKIYIKTYFSSTSKNYLDRLLYSSIYLFSPDLAQSNLFYRPCLATIAPNKWTNITANMTLMPQSDCRRNFFNITSRLSDFNSILLIRTKPFIVSSLIN